MPAHKKKATTSTKTQAISTVLSPEPLKPETFHQYLRAEIRHATQAVMEEIMREELSQISHEQALLAQELFSFRSRSLLDSCLFASLLAPNLYT